MDMGESLAASSQRPYQMCSISFLVILEGWAKLWRKSALLLIAVDANSWWKQNRTVIKVLMRAHSKVQNIFDYS